MRAFILPACFFAMLLTHARIAAENGAEGAHGPLARANASVAPSATALPIQDNSFLVEEAYNQEDGVIQHISFVQPSSTGDWVYTQIDERPGRSLKHRLAWRWDSTIRAHLRTPGRDGATPPLTIVTSLRAAVRQGWPSRRAFPYCCQRAAAM